jgi:16S rRNA (guanine527-N7)-methyltransferase
MTIDWQQTLAWTPSPEQLEDFEKFYQVLLCANQTLNLTRITSREDFWEKHLWDALSGIQPWLDQLSQPDWMSSLKAESSIKSVIDIGTGGGVPGIPVAIACPDWSVTLLDSTQKKILSLQEIAQSMAGQSLNPYCDRAESLGRLPGHRGQYDLALLRALGAAPICAEYALPLLKEQGIAVLYRGRWLPEEEAGLSRALDDLGGEIVHIHALKTPLTEGDRHCVYVKKIKPTPQNYPRRAGIPAREPLG